MKFSKIWSEERSKLMESVKESSEMTRTVLMELKDSRSYRVAAQRSRAKAMPKIPKDHDDMDPEKVGLGHLVLGRRKHPEEKNKDVILFGTLLSATAWAMSALLFFLLLLLHLLLLPFDPLK